MYESKSKMDHRRACVHILVLGAPRAGKSSLLRLLWGDATDYQSRDETRHEVGLERHVAQKEDLELAVLEGFGMDLHHSEKWSAFIYQECQDREEDPYVEAWFHGVVYCVAADMPAVDSLQLDRFIGPLLRSNHSVLFAITKADLVDEAKRDEHRRVIEANCPNYGSIIEVAGPHRAERSGSAWRELLFTYIRANIAANLKKQLRARYFAKCTETRGRWIKQVLADYDRRVRFIKTMKRTLQEVAGGAVSSLDQALANIEGWRREQDREAANLFRAFMSATSQEPESPLAHPIANPLSASMVEWGRGDVVANAVVNSLPGLNILHQMTLRKIQRERLNDILNEATWPLVRDAGRFADCGGKRDLALCYGDNTIYQPKFLS